MIIARLCPLFISWVSLSELRLAFEPCLAFLFFLVLDIPRSGLSLNFCVSTLACLCGHDFGSAFCIVVSLSLYCVRPRSAHCLWYLDFGHCFVLNFFHMDPIYTFKLLLLHNMYIEEYRGKKNLTVKKKCMDAFLLWLYLIIFDVIEPTFHSHLLRKPFLILYFQYTFQ